MSYNSRSPAVKRLLKEAMELQDKTELYYAKPLEDNIFEWHFTIRGPADTDFDGGIYHGRILFPAEYPMKPPSITFLTPNGRFRVNEKICLSISGHHPETWLPSWSIRTALLALIGFMPTMGEGALGSLDYTTDERRNLARKSVSYKCSTCNEENLNLLLGLTENSQKASAEAKELASQINFKNSKSTSEMQATTDNSNDTTASATVTETTVTTTTTTTTVTTSSNNSESDTSSFDEQAIRNRLKAAIQQHRTATTPSQSQVKRPTNNSGGLSGLLLFILFAIFLVLLIRRLYITFNTNEFTV